MAGILSKSGRTGVNSSFVICHTSRCLHCQFRVSKATVHFLRQTRNVRHPCHTDIHLFSMVEPFGERNLKYHTPVESCRTTRNRTEYERKPCSFFLVFPCIQFQDAMYEYSAGAKGSLCFAFAFRVTVRIGR